MDSGGHGAVCYQHTTSLEESVIMVDLIKTGITLASFGNVLASRFSSVCRPFLKTTKNCLNNEPPVCF